MTATAHIDIVAFAERLATVAHGDQLYGDMPYGTHLTAVAGVLSDAGCDPVTVACGYLHDTPEDTHVTKELLYVIFLPFGEEIASRIAETVDRVTDIPAENRRARHALTYPRIAEHAESQLVKFADRIANLREGIQTGSHSKLRMYLKERASFLLIMPRTDENAALYDLMIETYNLAAKVTGWVDQ